MPGTEGYARTVAASVPASPEHAEPREDHVVVLRPATWKDYERLDAIRGDRSVPRFTYLDGCLEIMSPSIDRDRISRRIGALVMAWCDEREIDYETAGSWTVKRRKKEAGAEADECFYFGTAARPRRPDLAIEVEWSARALEKLEVWARLGVPEVWVWRSDAIHVHGLRGDRYLVLERSRFLPDLDVGELAKFVRVAPTSRAVRGYRDALRSAR